MKDCKHALYAHTVLISGAPMIIIVVIVIILILMPLNIAIL